MQVLSNIDYNRWYLFIAHEIQGIANVQIHTVFLQENSR